MTLSTQSLAAPSAVASRDLHTGWTVSAVSGPVPSGLQLQSVPATVPGCVHTDLLSAGLIADPYLDDNEALQAWIGLCDWEYRTGFEWRPDAQLHHCLVFDGLDTVAEIRLNGVHLGSTRNMHRSYRFDVTEHLREGVNDLVVRFSSPIRFADAASLRLGYRPQVNRHPFNAIRKMACSFGWDWGLSTATSGLWRGVRLESWSTARLAAVRAHAGITETSLTEGAAAANGRLRLEVEIEQDARSAGPLRLLVSCAGERLDLPVPLENDSLTAELDLGTVAPWWPRGYGEPALHALDVQLVQAGQPVDGWSRRVGFRRAELVLQPDEHGTSFQFVVNGRRIWIRGANWIPDDAFPHRVTRARYARRIEQAEFANINLLRVWGGGIFEQDDFFELCDERGMLTWQDFLFACAAYAEEEELAGEVEAEVRQNITRLQHHPSLVLWNGSNENIWGHQEWNWSARLNGRSWGLGYYLRLLPDLVRELDPDRAYTPSSPWSGSIELPANDPEHGSMHEWEVWNRLDWSHYRDRVPRFLAEFGWQGPPAASTLRRSISDDPLTPESPGMLVHQKALSGNDKLTDGLTRHVRMPDDMPGWHWAMTWNQATAVGVAVEHLRSWPGICSGAVLWQLNDCWPVTSWSAVDGDGRAKPLLHRLRAAYADRLVTLQPRGSADGAPTVVACLVNEAGSRWSGTLTMRRLRFDGTELASTEIPVDLAARGNLAVAVPPALAEADDPGREVLIATIGDRRACWFFTEPRDSALAAADLDLDVQRHSGGVRVQARARVLVRDLTLLVDLVDPEAEVDRMLVDLLPGESVVFDIRTRQPDADWLRPGVLRSLNDLVAATVPA